MLRSRGMNEKSFAARSLPHQRLVAYTVALELLGVVRGAGLREARLRDQAMRAAVSACLNVAEAAGRTSAADRARVFGIARGEVLEVAAAMEIGMVAGMVEVERYRECERLVGRLYGLLTGLSGAQRR